MPVRVCVTDDLPLLFQHEIGIKSRNLFYAATEHIGGRQNRFESYRRIYILCIDRKQPLRITGRCKARRNFKPPLRGGF